MQNLPTEDLIKLLKGEGEGLHLLVPEARKVIADAQSIASEYASASDRAWPIAHLLAALRQRDRQITDLMSTCLLAGEALKSTSEQLEKAAAQNLELMAACEQYRDGAQLAIEVSRQLQQVMDKG